MRERTRQKLLLAKREAVEGSKQNIRKKVLLSISLGHPARMVQKPGGKWKMQGLEYGDPFNPKTFGTQYWVDLPWESGRTYDDF